MKDDKISSTDEKMKSTILRIIWTIKTIIQKHRYKRKHIRYLEIGPGPYTIPGFESLSIQGGRYVDYVQDASTKLQFPDSTFDLIYASHVLEHIPWYKTHDTLRDWFRDLKPGGTLEVWVPDGLKICKALLEAEYTGSQDWKNDKWHRFNNDQDVCLWASSRIFTYGDGTGANDHHNWHKAIFSPRYLEKVLLETGFTEVKQLPRSAVRGHDHGWINLGYSGVKPPKKI